MDVHRLSPLDTVTLALRNASVQVLFVIIELDGRMDHGQLQQAMQQLFVLYPILRCYLHTEENTHPEWRPLAMPKPHRLIRVANTDTGATDAIINLAESSQLDGKLIQTTVIRGPGRDTLCIAIDHAISDASGVKEIAYTLAALYSRLASGRSIPNTPQVSPMGSLRAVDKHIPISTRLKALYNWRIVTGHWQFGHGTRHAEPRPTFVHQQLGARRMERMKNYCKDYKATINDMLIAALFSALIKTTDNDTAHRLPVQFTIDLRRYLPAEQPHPIGNLSSSAHVWLKPGSASDFPKLLADTCKATTAIKNGGQPIAPVRMLTLLHKTGHQRTQRLLGKFFTASRDNGMGNPLLTNTGTLDSDRLDFGLPRATNAFMLGPCMLVPGLTMTASSYSNKLTLSCGFDSATTEKRYITDLLQRVCTLLSPMPE